LKSHSRKQSVYFDVLEFDSIKVKSDSCDVADNLSDDEDQTRFRLRSGTDISDSVNAARYRVNLRKKHHSGHDPSVIELLQEDKDPNISIVPSPIFLDKVECALSEAHEDILINELEEALPINLLLP